LGKKKGIRKQKIKRKIRWTYIDKNMVLFISNRRVKLFTAFMKMLTRIGDGVAWFVLCVVFLLLNGIIPGMAYTGIALAISSVIQVALQTIIKNIFNRPRPYVKYEEISHVLPPPDRFSFPSGHTAGAFAIAFVFYYFVPFLFVPMLILASLIAFSRIYLGLHYPSDIIAGIVLGLISALLGTQLTLLIEL
jgi:membrane-associated phospholipid phosphatase